MAACRRPDQAGLADFGADRVIRGSVGCESKDGSHPLRVDIGAAHIIDKTALLVLVVRNLKFPGAKLILIGMLLNFTAILANGGIMPVRPELIEVVYGRKYLAYAKSAPHVQSGIMDATCELSFLCDIVAARRPFVLVPAVYSVGDPGHVRGHIHRNYWDHAHPSAKGEGCCPKGLTR